MRHPTNSMYNLHPDLEVNRSIYFVVENLQVKYIQNYEYTQIVPLIIDTLDVGQLTSFIFVL
jgi:hypothetical protein